MRWRAKFVDSSSLVVDAGLHVDALLQLHKSLRLCVLVISTPRRMCEPLSVLCSIVLSVHHFRHQLDGC